MSEVALFMDFKMDESYTPAKVSVRVGNTFRDLREARRAAAGMGCALPPLPPPPPPPPPASRARGCLPTGPFALCPLPCLRLPLCQVRVIELQEPQGWVVVPLPPDDQPECVAARDAAAVRVPDGGLTTGHAMPVPHPAPRF